MIPPKFRRAKYSEVPNSIRSICKGLLREPLGSVHGPYVVQGRTFLVAIERHANAPKGASVWIEK